MENKTSRFLMLLATAALLLCTLTVSVFAESVEELEVVVPVCSLQGDVNDDAQINVADALQVLYAYQFPEKYTVNQDCDFNKSGAVDKSDAIYLLWASIDDSLKDILHSYYDPEWSWTEDYNAAIVTIRCGCGDVQETFSATVTKVTTEPSCVENGADVYTAVAGDYSDEKTVVIPATGHTMVGQVTCTTGSECQNCDYAEQATGHNVVLNAEKSKTATCTAQAMQVYECACGYSEDVTLEATLNHTYAYLQDVPVTDSVCIFVKQYKCATCENTINGTAESDTYTRHTYAVTLTKEVDCQNAGEKTYTCEYCDHSYTETVAADSRKHVWNNGVEADGVITYTCKICPTTKTAVSDKYGLGVCKADLADVGALALANDTAIQLDGAVMNQIAEDATVAVSVGTVDVDNIGITDVELKEQIGNNTVYDFTMMVNETALTVFDGDVTITLPYQLKEGEDIDSIGVWYIDNEGKPARIDAVYSNGFVTFKTNHFSYYSVTRLSVAERCAIYGHIAVNSSKAATCTIEGYDMVACQRCGEIVSKTIHKALGHNYIYTGVEPTCENEGFSEGSCGVCNHTISQILPVLGHKMELVEEKSQSASCAAAGVNVYACAHEGCNKTTQEILPQLPHNYESEEKKANCGDKGHKKKKCSVCGQEQIYDESAPTGHDYVNENTIWEWNNDYTEATVTLVCSYNTEHTKKLNAVVSRQYVQNPTCEQGGVATYTATASFNKGIFTKTIEEIEIPALEHIADSKWYSDGETHYHACQLCKQKIDSTVMEHGYGAQTVSREATCALPGKAVETCSVCDYVNNVILPFTDEHTYNASGICTGCGRDEDSCDAEAHKMLAIEFELEDPNGDCRDGYWVTKKCEICGYTEKTKGNTHEQHITAQYVLKDYDCCDGSIITLRRCACGAEMMPEFTGDCGIFSEMCKKCGSRAVPDMNGYKIENISACQTKVTLPAKLYNSDMEVKLEFTIEAISSSHYMQIDSVTFDKADGTCEDGYSAKLRCIHCGVEESMSGNKHNLYIMESVDLAAAGGCSGYIYQKKCACGREKEVSINTKCGKIDSVGGNSYVDDEGRWHFVSRYTCTTCNLMYASDSCSVLSGCKNTQCSVYEITLPNGTTKSMKQERIYESHSSTYYTYELEPGSITCEDGIIGYGHCKACGAQWEYSKDSNYHALGRNPEGDIDLAAYGAICGSKLEHQSCACGKYQSYQRPTDDTCDIGQQYTDVWIPGALNNSDGINSYFSSYAYIYKCAVTDPVACGLTIRMADYYLLENGCIPTHKQTWQLGYNEQTGTWAREITVKCSENTSAYHTYAMTNTQETQTDGTVVNTTMYLCPKCESYVKTMDYQQNGEQVKYVKEQINNLDNGFAKRNAEIKEYAYKFDGKRYTTLSRYEYAYDDGSDSWNQTEYTYDFANTCRYTSTYTYKSGSSTDTSVTEYEHDLVYNYTTVRPSTCTQNGRYFNGNVCRICNFQGSGSYSDTAPSGHWWNYNSDRNIHICGYCGLEGKNGADGAIVLEDLTDSKGNGTNYVVGYWNKEMLAATPKISVLLKDWDNDQRILNIDPTYWTISEHDVRAVVYNIEQVGSAARTAMANENYTGDFAIRVSFVPDTGDTTLDYAITFDSLS